LDIHQDKIGKVLKREFDRLQSIAGLQRLVSRLSRMPFSNLTSALLSSTMRMRLVQWIMVKSQTTLVRR